MRRLTVLAYHAVGYCAPADDPHELWVATRDFAWQMAYLAERREVVSLADAVAGRVGGRRPAVAITFDDGYRSVLHHAAPILAEHGFPATVFVPSQHIGDRNRWDPPTACALDIMTADELREVERLGVSVESHGHAHVDLSAADADTARRDIAPSLVALEALTGRRPSFLAYPFRTGSTAAQQVARELGLRAAFTIALPHAGTYAWGRVAVKPTESPRTFALKTSGWFLALRHHRAYRLVRR